MSEGGQSPEAQTPGPETVIQPPVREATPDLGDRVPADKLLEKAQEKAAQDAAAADAVKTQVDAMSAAATKDSPNAEWLDRSGGTSASTEEAQQTTPSAEANKPSRLKTILKAIGLG